MTKADREAQIARLQAEMQRTEAQAREARHRGWMAVAGRLETLGTAYAVRLSQICGGIG